tara:strand:+ start:38329 stop:38478 length:150 start_codon:yes stop_codon:yes gene_type:complete
LHKKIEAIFYGLNNLLKTVGCGLIVESLKEVFICGCIKYKQVCGLELTV